MSRIEIACLQLSLAKSENRGKKVAQQLMKTFLSNLSKNLNQLHTFKFPRTNVLLRS